MLHMSIKVSEYGSDRKTVFVGDGITVGWSPQERYYIDPPGNFGGAVARPHFVEKTVWSLQND